MKNFSFIIYVDVYKILRWNEIKNENKKLPTKRAKLLPESSPQKWDILLRIDAHNKEDESFEHGWKKLKRTFMLGWFVDVVVVITLLTLFGLGSLSLLLVIEE